MTTTRKPTVVQGDGQSHVEIHKLRAESVAHGSDKTRVLYRLSLFVDREFRDKLRHDAYLCLSWPLGGIWKVKRYDTSDSVPPRSSHRTFLVHCEASRRSQLTSRDCAALNKLYADPSIQPTEEIWPVFGWAMKTRQSANGTRWFVSQEMAEVSSSNRRLVATILTKLPHVEVSLNIDAIHDIDTSRQRYTADVTWTVTLPQVTVVRDDAILHEFLRLIEFNETVFSFTNALDVRKEEDILTEFTRKDDSASSSAQLVPAPLYDLRFSRRIVAEFTAQLNLRTFPFDRQTLSFAFAMGRGLSSCTAILPVVDNPGTFELENFTMANVWRTRTDDMVLVGAVKDEGTVKTIRFEIMLERRCRHYLTNIAFPVMVITYLCFTSYAPLKGTAASDGTSNTTQSNGLMDTDARLQIVVALLLTAVTFKSQVVASIPQVSYFTTLDLYVLACFLIASTVAVETALYPVATWAIPNFWREGYLLWPSVAMFTMFNIGAALYLHKWNTNRHEQLSTFLHMVKYAHATTDLRSANGGKLNAEIRKELVQNRISKLRPRESKFAVDELIKRYTVTTTGGEIFIKLPSDQIMMMMMRCIGYKTCV